MQALPALCLVLCTGVDHEGLVNWNTVASVYLKLKRKRVYPHSRFATRTEAFKESLPFV